MFRHHQTGCASDHIYNIKHFIVLKRSVADLKCCTFFAWFLVIKHIFQRRKHKSRSKSTTSQFFI